MTTNQERASHCERVIEAYDVDDLATNLIDLLCDAMHWCDHNGENFHLLLANACRHYIHELNDEQTKRTRMS
jgi:hypothetical protein